MKNFILFFNSNEGSTAIMSQLKKSELFNILWLEPFDNHHLKKELKDQDLEDILSYTYTNDNSSLSDLYKEYSNTKLDYLYSNRSTGFKMRPRNLDHVIPILKEQKIHVFVLIRENILKSAISRCQTNLLQFELAQGKIKENPPITIDISVLQEKINLCKKINQEKYKLLENLKKLNISASPLYYEKFCSNKLEFFKDIFQKLEIKISAQDLCDFCNQELYYKKVHSDDISKFIVNYQEVLDYIQKNKLDNYL
jgi:hypothetical protein